MRLLALASVLMLATVAVLPAGGCTRGGQPGQSLSLSEAELRYGQSPSRSHDITYQPGVITIDNGAQAVHDVSPDGLTWTFDANAPHAQDVAPGKILFLTSRAVGQVLGVTRNGNDLAVTLGPIAITDLIKEADITTDQPIDLAAVTAYVAPNYPQPPNVIASPQAELPFSLASDPLDLAPGSTSVQVLRLDSSGAAFALPMSFAQAAAPPAPVDINDFNVTPFCCGGIGIKIAHNSGGVTLLAFAVIRVNAPSLHFNLKITHGTIKTAEVELRGVAGLTMKLESGSTVGVQGNIKTPPLMVPVDLSWPINLAPPFAMTLHQSFLVSTGFTSKNSTLTAGGDYAFTGSFKMGYHEGSWGVSAPTSFTVRQSFLDSVGGIAIGPEALLLAYQAKIIVGVGAFGFVTGPYLGYTTSFGVVEQGAVGFPCHGATIKIGMNVGIGYSIPHPLTSAINFFLRKLNLGQIQGSGGLEHPFEPIIEKKGSFPARCAGY